jgi:NodT family efflux transporter outer membrane factor (OMF) lipoprotein
MFTLKKKKAMNKTPLFLLVFLSSCLHFPKYKAHPHPSFSENWQTPICEEAQKEPPPLAFWKEFKDPCLNWLMEEAASQNLDLMITACRLEQARRALKATSSQNLPKIDASAGFYHAYFNQKTLDQVLGLEDETGRHHRNLDLFEIGFDAEWEIDLFGRQKHQMHAACYRLRASEEEFNVFWVTLSAEIARAYFDLRVMQNKKLLVEKTIQSINEKMELTQDLVQAGFKGDLDLVQERIWHHELVSRLPLIEFSVTEGINRLSLLLGKPPGFLQQTLAVASPLPSPPEGLSVGVPSMLLRRRADIRQKEMEMEEASSLVCHAMASMFPRLSLKGFVGQISTHLPELLSGSGFTWLGGPQLLLPIFNSRLIEQDIQINKLKVKQALLEYQKTTLVALEEAENGIAYTKTRAQHFQLQQMKLQTSKDGYEMAKDLYQSGLASFFEVLLQEKEWIQSQESLLESHGEYLKAALSLYKALGGGWDCVE